jgi:hypothetical protein
MEIGWPARDFVRSVELAELYSVNERKSPRSKRQKECSPERSEKRVEEEGGLAR